MNKLTQELESHFQELPQRDLEIKHKTLSLLSTLFVHIGFLSLLNTPLTSPSPTQHTNQINKSINETPPNISTFEKPTPIQINQIFNHPILQESLTSISSSPTITQQKFKKALKQTYLQHPELFFQYLNLSHFYLIDEYIKNPSINQYHLYTAANNYKKLLNKAKQSPNLKIFIQENKGTYYEKTNTLTQLLQDISPTGNCQSLYKIQTSLLKDISPQTQTYARLSRANTNSQTGHIEMGIKHNNQIISYLDNDNVSSDHALNLKYQDIIKIYLEISSPPNSPYPQNPKIKEKPNSIFASIPNGGPIKINPESTTPTYSDSLPTKIDQQTFKLLNSIIPLNVQQKPLHQTTTINKNQELFADKLSNIFRNNYTINKNQELKKLTPTQRQEITNKKQTLLQNIQTKNLKLITTLPSNLTIDIDSNLKESLYSSKSIKSKSIPIHTIISNFPFLSNHKQDLVYQTYNLNNQPTEHLNFLQSKNLPKIKNLLSTTELFKFQYLEKHPISPKSIQKNIKNFNSTPFLKAILSNKNLHLTADKIDDKTLNLAVFNKHLTSKAFNIFLSKIENSHKHNNSETIINLIHNSLHNPQITSQDFQKSLKLLSKTIHNKTQLKLLQIALHHKIHPNSKTNLFPKLIEIFKTQPEQIIDIDPFLKLSNNTSHIQFLLNQNVQFTYDGQLESTHFPTAHFNTNILNLTDITKFSKEKHLELLIKSIDHPLTSIETLIFLSSRPTYPVIQYLALKKLFPSTSL